MLYGPVPPKKLPQQDSTKVLKMADRWYRASKAHARWAEIAKQCVDFTEGRQWTEEALAKMASENRVALKLNMIAPLIRLVLGYHRNNRIDLNFLPGYDGPGTEIIGEVLTHIDKQISELNQTSFVDTEVFMDGIIASRGYYDTRLDFTDNDLGEVKEVAKDPFSIFLDPDGDKYDLSNCGYIFESRMVSIDEIEHNYGKQAARLIEPFTLGQMPISPLDNNMINQEDSPRRTFGETEDADFEYWNRLNSQLGDWIDPQRRSVRMLDCQHMVSEVRNVFIDLETGDRSLVPHDWKRDKIEKVLYHAETLSNPVIVEKRLVRRPHWTTMVGDVILLDRPSPYNTYTYTGYFPYFRRGATRGMVEDLIDPQREKNKRRSAGTEIVSRNANGGWLFRDSTFTPEQEQNLQRYGSTPGVRIKYKHDAKEKPEQIQSNTGHLDHKRLEVDAMEDLNRISGINEAALGELDRVQSGRALEARQRQAVIGLQMYMDNFSRTKELVGRKRLAIVQGHYTEERMFRIMGEDGKLAETLINQKQVDPVTGAITRIHDVTLGKYNIVVDERPLSASYANAQFEEALLVMEKMGPVGQMLLQIRPDLLVDMSTLPRKEEWSDAIKQAIGLIEQQRQQDALTGAPVSPAEQPQNAPSIVQGVEADGVRTVGA